MLNPIEQFRENIIRVDTLGELHTTIGDAVPSEVDLTDLLRSQIVMIVSALDLYIHEITRTGMLEVYNKKRPQTGAFLWFQVPLESAMESIELVMQSILDVNEDVRNKKEWLDDKWLDSEIRERHSYKSFQNPDDIADAIRLFSSCKLWQDVAEQLNLDVQNVKSRLIAIFKRRNQIVHEADLVPTYPGTTTRWPISPADVSDTLDFIQNVCEAIHMVSNQNYSKL